MVLLKKITLISLIFSIPLLGHSYKVEKFVKDDKSIICFSDFHISDSVKNQVNNLQRQEILQIAKESKAFMVIEDMQKLSNIICKDCPSKNSWALTKVAQKFAALITGGDQPITAPAYIMTNTPLQYDSNNYIFKADVSDQLATEVKTSYLHGLASACYYENISYKNIEHRHAKVLSEWDDRVKMRDGFACAEKIKSEISGYNDHGILNEYYQDVVRDYDWILQKAKPFFDYLNASELSFNDVTQTYAYQSFATTRIRDVADRMYARAKVKRYDDTAQGAILLAKRQKMALNFDTYLHYLFLLSDARLVNARILHTAYEYSAHGNVCICAGGDHIAQISPLLERLGWKKVFEVGQDFDGQEPEAIDLSSIKDILLSS